MQDLSLQQITSLLEMPDSSALSPYTANYTPNLIQTSSPASSWIHPSVPTPASLMGVNVTNHNNNNANLNMNMQMANIGGSNNGNNDSTLIESHNHSQISNMQGYVSNEMIDHYTHNNTNTNDNNNNINHNNHHHQQTHHNDNNYDTELRMSILQDLSEYSTTTSPDTSTCERKFCQTSSQANKSNPKKKKSGKSTYKHVPHREKPAHLVARRNARERRRVQAVNSAFARLRKAVPVENRSKRLSKVKTLQRAIEYIHNLMDMLDEADDIQAANILTQAPISFSTMNNCFQS